MVLLPHVERSKKLLVVITGITTMKRGNKMYRLSPDAVQNSAMIQKYVETYRTESARLNKLHDYYIGRHEILNRKVHDSSKPCNRLVSGYPKLITDTMSAFFAGEAVTYSYPDEDSQLVFDGILQYNDESQENSKLAMDCSIYGVAYELLYHDADANIRFKALDARYAIPIYDNTLENALLYFIRYYDETDIMTGNVKTYVEVYDKSSIKRYLLEAYSISFIEETAHYFNDVPVCVYQNNGDVQGDFEGVLTLIDAYNLLESCSMDDFQYFTDAYLALTGLQGTEASDIASMKEQRVILLPDNAKAEWLIKASNDTATENMKKRLHSNILLFSKTPDMTDENFASNASGVAMKYKLLGLENTAGIKERYFKLALQRRFELICNALSVLGSDFDYMSIQMQFHRSLPQNQVEISEFLSKVGHLLSEETQIQMLGLDVDAQAEIDKRNAEKDASVSLPFDIAGDMNA